MSIWSSGNQIVNNHIHDNGNPASTSSNGQDGVYEDSGCSGNVFAGNWIDHNGRTGSNLDHGLYLCGDNDRVYNNVLFANAASGLQIAGYTTVSNMKVYNNVMAWNGTSGIILWQDLSGVDIKNNIIYQNSHYGIGSWAATGSGVLVNNNVLYNNAYGDLDFVGGSSTYTYSQSGNTIADPRMVSQTSSSLDPHLASGSPGIQAGVNLSSSLTTDMSGRARPASGAWDLGVYVYGSAPSPTVSVAATTPNASRLGLSNGVFTISRTGSTAASLTVNCSLSGSATAGADYTAVGTSVTIPAGAASATVAVAPLPSTTLVRPKTVSLGLASGAGYTVGASSAATVTIGGNSLPCAISRAAGNNAKITWASTAGKSYRVASKNSLGDANWTDLSGLVTAAGTSTAYTDTGASARTQRFYVVYLTN
jgi:hypothetical protein